MRPDCFWISKLCCLIIPIDLRLTKTDPYAVHFSTITVADLVLVDEEGRPVEPTTHKVNAAGFIIHSSIHKARPDVNAACHLHAPHSRAWSTFGLPIEMINQGKYVVTLLPSLI